MIHSMMGTTIMITKQPFSKRFLVIIKTPFRVVTHLHTSLNDETNQYFLS